MNLLREPLIPFLAIAITSLIVTLVLFKVIQSTAHITSRGTLITGGLAGYVIIFGTFWYAYAQGDKAVVAQPLQPINVPEGFEAISEPELAIAVPRDYAPGRKEKAIRFTEKEKGQMFGMLDVTIIENVSLESMADFKPQNLPEEVQKAMSPLLKWDTAQPAPYQGRKGFIMPMTITLPKDVEPEQKPRTVKVLAHFILDDRKRRLITVMYEDTELGRQIFSTLNLAPDDK
jgi:hypothetical protein